MHPEKAINDLYINNVKLNINLRIEEGKRRKDGPEEGNKKEKVKRMAMYSAVWFLFGLFYIASRY